MKTKTFTWLCMAETTSTCCTLKSILNGKALFCLRKNLFVSKKVETMAGLIVITIRSREKRYSHLNMAAMVKLLVAVQTWRIR